MLDVVGRHPLNMARRASWICDNCLKKWISSPRHTHRSLSGSSRSFTTVQNIKSKSIRLSAGTFARRQSSTATFFQSNRVWSISASADAGKARADVEAPPIIAPEEENDLQYPPAGLIYKENPPLTIARLAKIYSALSKGRLTALIVLTAMSGYALSPITGSVSILLSTALGTTLCCAAANSLNQLQESPYDAQMVRTRSRPLVRRAITPFHAFSFACITGSAGVGLLWTCVNPLTASLGALNIFLYAGVYTYLKRQSIVNTWVGAVVGGIPPLMGWTACGGSLLPSSISPVILFLPNFDPSTILPGPIDNPLAAWTLFALLYSWQFPHFNPLSLMMASDYARAGFQMLSVISPSRNAAVCLRHALVLIPICSILTPLSGLTTWWFALSSLVPNAIAVRAAWKFWRTNNGLSEKMARQVWRISLWWLPVILGLMMIHKKDARWSSFFGSEVDIDVDGAEKEI